MKKIDLHIHTIATPSDALFEFDIAKLKEYVTKLEIDCIAITNHNLFDLEQYTEISNELDIKVYPGVEIDLDGGHLLLIADTNEAVDFSIKCSELEKHFSDPEDAISFETFHEIFPSLEKYILIPHYDKKPFLSNSIIAKFNGQISAGEVSSVKKFICHSKTGDGLVPVLFSDSRFHSSLEPLPTRQTFFDLDDITFSGLKYCLTDKQKVFLTKDDGNSFFQATDDGLKLSTGLSIILGERSSGKTYTLGKIHSSCENAKYIKQFSLLQDDEDKFKSQLSRRHSSVSEEYLAEFKPVLEDVKGIDLEQNENDLGKYLETLLKFASESEKKDAFSKSKLFSETLFTPDNLSTLKKLIEATTLLKENTEHKSTINRHISHDSLSELEIDLMKKYISSEEENKKKEWLNSIISNIQSELKARTSATSPNDVDFYKVLIDKEKVKKFNDIVSTLRTRKVIKSKEIRNFKIEVTTQADSGAADLKARCSSSRIKFSEVFPHYNNPYKYLCSLKELDLADSELYRYFVKINYKTLNKHGTEVSGGERSEFNLLHEINDALKYDMLLIDEPESSFDNLFLQKEVNSLLKEIAKEIPVIIVTHNNTVGASIKPNYIAYTKREIISGTPKYTIFSGCPSDKKLQSINGDKINNYDVMLNCLEAGQAEYTKRRTETYEILKN